MGAGGQKATTTSADAVTAAARSAALRNGCSGTPADWAVSSDNQLDFQAGWTHNTIGTGKDGKPVYLKDIWPSNKEVADAVHKVVTREMFLKKYADVFAGEPEWQTIKIAEGMTYNWDNASTYVQNPPYFEGMKPVVSDGTFQDIKSARLLAILGDSITTDHISPAGSIKAASPAGSYLIGHAERMRYRFAILAGPKDADQGAIRAVRGQYDSTYAALYYPWLVTPAPGGASGDPKPADVTTPKPSPVKSKPAPGLPQTKAERAARIETGLAL